MNSYNQEGKINKTSLQRYFCKNEWIGQLIMKKMNTDFMRNKWIYKDILANIESSYYITIFQPWKKLNNH